MARESQPCIEGGGVHAWKSTGLDNTATTAGPVLSNTRRCVWCGRCEAKPYGTRRQAWKKVAR